MWSPDELLTIASRGLQEAARRLDAEQAVRGIDALAEVELHPILSEVFVDHGLGVVREQPLPGEPETRPEDRQRERCDLVLLPAPDLRLADPLRRVRERDRAEGTLFESVERRRPDEEREIPVADAYWLELKVVGQFVVVDAYAQPNRAYAGELVNAVAQDVRKLSRDPHIDLGAVLVVLFTVDEPVAAHDLQLALHRCLDRDVPLGLPHLDGFPIADRIGNAWCQLALIPARS